MIYTYQCTNEGCKDATGERTIVEAELSIKEDFRALHPPCTSCGDHCDYHWVPSVFQFAMKDGPTTGMTPSKSNRFAQFRRKSSEQAAIRQRDRYGEAKKAIPNYKGQETGTWEEAKYQAIKEKGLEAAPTFDAKIAETNKNKIIV